MKTPILYTPDSQGFWLRISPHGITKEVVRYRSEGRKKPRLYVWEHVGCKDNTYFGCWIEGWVLRMKKPGRWIKVAEWEMWIDGHKPWSDEADQRREVHEADRETLLRTESYRFKQAIERQAAEQAGYRAD